MTAEQGGVICLPVRAILAIPLFAFVGCADGPPSVPVVFGPTMGRPDFALRFSCYSTSPGAKDVSYQFDWGDGTRGEWSPWTSAGLEYDESHVFSDTGVFFVICRARDERQESGWSDGLQVRVARFPPYVPRRPSGPDTVDVGDSVSFASSSVHPLGDRVALQFDWGESLSEWTQFVASGAWVYVRHAFSERGAYPVRARAKDGLNQVSDWSSPRVVTVVGADRAEGYQDTKGQSRHQKADVGSLYRNRGNRVRVSDMEKTPVDGRWQ